MFGGQVLLHRFVKQGTSVGCVMSVLPHSLVHLQNLLQHPDYPFQQVVADYFQAGGYHYLVVLDQFSGWLTVFFCGGSVDSSRQLQDWLRQFFTTYGIPEE